MTFTYDPTTTRGKVRLLIGDRDTTTAQFQDEEIDAVLAVQGTPTYAAAALLESLAAQMARLATISIGKTSVEYRNLATELRAQAHELRKNAGQLAGGDGSGVSSLGMQVGGISIAEREDFETGDDDRVQPEFKLDQDDHPPTNVENTFQKPGF